MVIDERCIKVTRFTNRFPSMYKINKIKVVGLARWSYSIGVAHLNHTVQSHYCKVDYDLKFTLEKSPKQGAFLNSIKFETKINYLIPSYIEMKHVI